jgi:hypothetical protein
MTPIRISQMSLLFGTRRDAGYGVTNFVARYEITLHSQPRLQTENVWCKIH